MKYNVIYADPPWRYDFSKSNSRKIESHYETMSIDEIKNMKIPCDDNAVLFMWTTSPKLKESIEVLECWGFEYKTCAVWDKEIIGMGYWFRSQHELLLVGVKGNFSPPDVEKRVSSILKSKRDKHSKKPDFIRFMIESWYPDSKRLELFARDQNYNWNCFGNELSKTKQKRLET